MIAGVLGEWIDATVILVIVILNAVMGFIQEYRAEKSLRTLRKLATPTSRVIRGGTVQSVASRDIVPGNLVVLEAGDRIPADGRIVQSFLLRTQEAAMTGESMPVEKITGTILQDEVSIDDRKNCALMGTVAVYGKGQMIVTETGLTTELGRIAEMLQTAETEPTPLQKSLEKLGHRLVGIFLAIVSLVFLLGVIRGKSLVEMLLTSLSLAVVAIPEGLPAVVTVALTIGVQKMAKRHALIRRLASVETLGCASVICTDKTGTLTQNEMTVRHVWMNDQLIDIEGVGYVPQGKFMIQGKEISPGGIPELERVLQIGVLCNSADLVKTEEHGRSLAIPRREPCLRRP
ncbi:MAG: HAD-IC family P-type ATPase [Candidatus Omnitrophica bacterium]|nr:HAD-IC family P-type ATPase [Candidatus Omnitrophota bacterium]